MSAGHHAFQQAGAIDEVDVSVTVREVYAFLAMVVAFLREVVGDGTELPSARRFRAGYVVAIGEEPVLRGFARFLGGHPNVAGFCGARGGDDKSIWVGSNAEKTKVFIAMPA